MSDNIVRYEFDAAIEPVEIEATLVLAIVAVEAIHGEVATRLGVSHCFDAVKRVCVIDVAEAVGRDFNCVFHSFASREFGTSGFRARRVTTATTSPSAVAA